MHAPKPETSPQLQRLLNLLRHNRNVGITPRDMQEQGICDYHSAICALRKHGYRISAELDRVTYIGAKVFRYQLQE